MPSYGRCKIEYVYMLMFLFVITETNCIIHKYDEPRHILINGDVAVYEQQGKHTDSLLKYGNKIVHQIKGKMIASGKNVVPVSEDVTQERSIRVSVSSPNLSKFTYPMKWKSEDSERRNDVCKGSEAAWSLTPQLVALVAAVCSTVIFAVTSIALVCKRRTWRCQHCQATASAAAAAAAATAATAATATIGRPGARSRSRHTPERKRGWNRDPTPYPSLERSDSPDAAAGDAVALRAALSDTFSDMLLSSPSTSTSLTPSELNMVIGQLPAVHTEPPANGVIVRLPGTFHFRPQFRTRSQGPAA